MISQLYSNKVDQGKSLKNQSELTTNLVLASYDKFE